MASPAPVHPAPSDARAWREALEALPAGTAPCYGLEGARWGEIRAAAIDFLDRFGGEAAALGWTEIDLFGVHPKIGVGRVDFCGALMLGGGRVSGITADRLAFTRTAFYRGMPGRPQGVAVWAFRR